MSLLAQGRIATLCQEEKARQCCGIHPPGIPPYPQWCSQELLRSVLLGRSEVRVKPPSPQLPTAGRGGAAKSSRKGKQELHRTTPEWRPSSDRPGWAAASSTSRSLSQPIRALGTMLQGQFLIPAWCSHYLPPLSLSLSLSPMHSVTAQRQLQRAAAASPDSPGRTRPVAARGHSGPKTRAARRENPSG